MNESVIELIEEYNMSNQEREIIQTKIQNWLIEEGYKVSKQDDPKTYFTILAEHFPTNMKIGVSQTLDSKDRILVNGSVTFDNPDQFRNLPNNERLDFLWDLRFTLVTNDCQFMMIPNGQFPDQVVIIKKIWYDGLTKDRFMSVAQKVVEGKLLAIWKYKEKLGAPEPADKYIPL